MQTNYIPYLINKYENIKYKCNDHYKYTKEETLGNVLYLKYHDDWEIIWNCELEFEYKYANLYKKANEFLNGIFEQTYEKIEEQND